MAPLSHATPALACMQEIQEECFKMGIPLVTRHREAAPGQFEFAPKYGSVSTQVDQNLVVMQVVEETASKHGLAALFQEKPFQVSMLLYWLCCVMCTVVSWRRNELQQILCFDRLIFEFVHRALTVLASTTTGRWPPPTD